MRILLLLFFLCSTSYAAKWTCIQRWMGTSCHTWRMEVPGGWIISGEGYNNGEYAMTFVPDINHEWKDQDN